MVTGDEMKERIQYLVKQLNIYRNAYYNESKSLISDYEYDELYDELEKLEYVTGIIYSNSPTQSVGYEVVSKLQKVKHSHPMMSLDKTKITNDLVEFSNGRDCVLSLKMDGLTTLITYDFGRVIQAETRGNGLIGEVITHNVKAFENLPYTIHTSSKFEFEGESIILLDDFNNINNKIINECHEIAKRNKLSSEELEKLIDEKTYKTPRNLASGSVRQLNSEVTKNRHVKFIVWKVPYGVASYTSGFKLAKQMGFEVVPYVTYNSKTDNIDEKIDILTSIAKEKGYPIDGIVCTYNDVKFGKSLGMTNHHARNAIAYKFYDEENVTTLKTVEWSMGKTGQLTPVAVFEDTVIDGTTVNRASLHNVSVFKSFELGAGDEITVYKSNMIIPQIRDNLSRSGTLTIPDTCPICGEQAQVIKDNESEVLICSNPDCPGKLLGKISHAVSRNALNIDGLSDATIEKFISLGWLKSISDIYSLKKYEKNMKSLSGFGKKSVDKLLASIEISRKTELNRFINALSIPMIGNTASKAIAKYCDGSVDKFFTGMDEKFPYINIEGIGTQRTEIMHDFWNNHKEEVKSFAREFVFEETETSNTASNNLENMIFVITGSLNEFENRDAAKYEIEKHGGKVSGSISSRTNFLVNNDVNSTSTKNTKAKNLGIPIINESELISILNSNTI